MRACIQRVCIRQILSLSLLVATVVPAARAEDLGSVLGLYGDSAGDRSGVDPRTAAWDEAGLCGGMSARAPTRPAVGDRPPQPFSADPFPVDQCGHHDAGCVDPDCRTDAASGCCDIGDISDTGDAARQFYITGIIGVSFGVLQSGGTNTALGPFGEFQNTGLAATDLLTAGAAAGTAFARSNGWLRLEVEGRGRDILTGQTNSYAPPTPTYFYQVRAADGWSVLANAWRDWNVGERLGFYGGGGVGAGGYRLTVNDGEVGGYGHVGGFAWQVGTGTTYRLTRRTTLDLGYRFFDTVSDSLPLTTSNGGFPAGSYQSNFYASELLLSVRIYEPFRSPSVR